MTEDLKPCPFCGESFFLEDFSDYYPGTEIKIYFIACLVCESKGGPGETFEEAVKLWNTRASESEEEQ